MYNGFVFETKPVEQADFSECVRLAKMISTRKENGFYDLYPGLFLLDSLHLEDEMNAFAMIGGDLDRLTNGNQFGQPEEGGDMTPEKPWPYNQQRNRDQAAERIGLVELDLLRLSRSRLTDEQRAIVQNALLNINYAIRWLEAAGAQTLPPEL